MSNLIHLLETITAKRIAQMIKEKGCAEAEIPNVLQSIEFIELEDWFSTGTISIGLQFTTEEYRQLTDMIPELYEYMKEHNPYKTEHELLQSIFTSSIYEMVGMIWYEEVFNPLYQNRIRILPAVLKEYNI